LRQFARQPVGFFILDVQSHGSTRSLGRLKLPYVIVAFN
jgi:hypothetical protein